MERLLPLPHPKLRIVRNSNRIRMWVIYQKCFFAWEVGSAIVTMKEHMDWDDWVRGYS